MWFLYILFQVFYQAGHTLVGQQQRRCTGRFLHSSKLNKEDVQARYLTNCAFSSAEYCYRHPELGQAHNVVMAPKAEKQPAKKSVSKVGGAKSGRKKGSKKAIESYKIYIYKVRMLTVQSCHRCGRVWHGNAAPQVFCRVYWPGLGCRAHILACFRELVCAGTQTSTSRHWNIFQSNVHIELLHR